MKDLAAALSDIYSGFTNREMWARMAWTDVRMRYKRTILGPFWATLNMAIFIVALGLVFSHLWKMELADYLPYLCSGFLVWNPITAIITESGSVFVAASGTLLQIKVPYSTFIFATIYRNFIIFLHHAVVYIGVIIVYPVPVNMNTLLVIPGLLFIGVNSFWVGSVVGMTCARYRDIQPLLTNILQIVIFLTPIFWTPDMLRGRGRLALVDMNPFYHFIDIVRSPLLGKAPALLSWYVVSGFTVVGLLVAVYCFKTYRKKLCYWL